MKTADASKRDFRKCLYCHNNTLPPSTSIRNQKIQHWRIVPAVGLRRVSNRFVVGLLVDGEVRGRTVYLSHSSFRRPAFPPRLRVVLPRFVFRHDGADESLQSPRVLAEGPSQTRQFLSGQQALDSAPLSLRPDHGLGTRIAHRYSQLTAQVKLIVVHEPQR